MQDSNLSILISSGAPAVRWLETVQELNKKETLGERDKILEEFCKRDFPDRIVTSRMTMMRAMALLMDRSGDSAHTEHAVRTLVQRTTNRLCSESKPNDSAKSLLYGALAISQLASGDTKGCEKSFMVSIDCFDYRCKSAFTWPLLGVWTGIAEFYMRGSKYQDCLRVLHVIMRVETRCNFLSWPTMAALCHWRLGNRAIAVRFAEHVLRNDQEYVDALYLRGVLFLEEGDESAALTRFLRVLRVDPDHEEAILQSAHLLLFKGQDDIAIEMVRKVIRSKMSQNRAWAKYIQGRCYHRRSLFDQAINLYEQALLDDSDNLMIKTGLSQALLTRCNDRNRTYLLRIVELLSLERDRSVVVIRCLGLAFYYLNRYDEALPLLESIMELGEFDGYVTASLSQIYITRRKWKRGLSVLNILKNRNVVSEQAVYHNAGICLYRMGLKDFGKMREALEHFERAIIGTGSDLESISANTLAAQYMRARCLEAIGEKVEASRFVLFILLASLDAVVLIGRIYTCMFTCFPGYSPAVLRLAELSYTSNEADLTRQIFENVDPGDIALLTYSTASLYLRRGDLKKAEYILKRSLKKNQNDPIVHCLMGGRYLSEAQFNATKLAKLAADLRRADATNLDVLKEQERILKRNRYISLSMAKQEYTSALLNDNTNLNAANGLAIVKAESGDIPGAMEMFEEVLDQAEASHANESDYILTNYAHCLISNAPNRASAIYKTLLKRKPLSVELALALGAALFDQKDFVGAANICLKYFFLFPFFKTLLFNFCLCVFHDCRDIQFKVQKIYRSAERAGRAHNKKLWVTTGDLQDNGVDITSGNFKERIEILGVVSSILTRLSTLSETKEVLIADPVPVSVYFRPDKAALYLTKVKRLLVLIGKDLFKLEELEDEAKKTRESVASAKFEFKKLEIDRLKAQEVQSMAERENQLLMAKESRDKLGQFLSSPFWAAKQVKTEVVDASAEAGGERPKTAPLDQ